MKRDYSLKTEKLIEQMCQQNVRENFELDKDKAEECLLKTYDLFDLPRPEKIVWLKDIFAKKFQESAWSTESAWSARSAGSAESAASAARSAGAAGVGSAASAASAAADVDNVDAGWRNEAQYRYYADKYLKPWHNVLVELLRELAEERRS